MFTAVVRVTGAGRLADFRERLRWLMVRDEDAEEYSEHHAEGVLEYRFTPRKGIPFPAFTAASANPTRIVLGMAAGEMSTSTSTGFASMPKSE